MWFCGFSYGWDGIAIGCCGCVTVVGGRVSCVSFIRVALWVCASMLKKEGRFRMCYATRYVLRIGILRSFCKGVFRVDGYNCGAF